MGTEFHPCHILEPQNATCGVAADYDVFKIGHLVQPAFCPQGVLHLLPIAARRGSDGPCGRLNVLLADGFDHIIGGEPQRSQPLRVHPYAHAVIECPENVRFADALEARQRILYVDAHVIT